MQPDWMQKAAASAEPMAAQTVPVVPGRKLHVDGDMLAYWAGGNEDTDVATSRRILATKVEAMQYAAGAEGVIVHLTARTSTKGNRFLIATQKPYQGQRKAGRKPKNWEYLRDWMEAGDSFPFRIKLWANREADDGFAYIAATSGASAVICTKDKDMRMITGCWHQNWDDLSLLFVPLDTFELVHNEKLYGHKWFWQQMLQGDTADNIPGLPRYAGKAVGEATAQRLLKDTSCNDDALQVVAGCYELEFAEEWRERFVEQAMLLWLRDDQDAWVGNFWPRLRAFTKGLRLKPAIENVEQRIKEAYAQAAEIQGS